MAQPTCSAAKAGLFAALVLVLTAAYPHDAPSKTEISASSPEPTVLEQGTLRKTPVSKIQIIASSPEPALPLSSEGTGSNQGESARPSLAQKEAMADQQLQRAAVTIREAEAEPRRLGHPDPEASVEDVKAVARAPDAPASPSTRSSSLLWAPVLLAAVGVAGFMTLRFFTQPGATPAPLLCEAELPSADTLDEWYSS